MKKQFLMHNIERELYVQYTHFYFPWMAITGLIIRYTNRSLGSVFYCFITICALGYSLNGNTTRRLNLFVIPSHQYELKILFSARICVLRPSKKHTHVHTHTHTHTHTQIPVSYTHLDVYKRQVLYILIL